MAKKKQLPNEAADKVQQMKKKEAVILGDAECIIDTDAQKTYFNANKCNLYDGASNSRPYCCPTAQSGGTIKSFKCEKSECSGPLSNWFEADDPNKGIKRKERNANGGTSDGGERRKWRMEHQRNGVGGGGGQRKNGNGKHDEERTEEQIAIRAKRHERQKAKEAANNRVDENTGEVETGDDVNDDINLKDKKARKKLTLKESLLEVNEEEGSDDEGDDELTKREKQQLLQMGGQAAVVVKEEENKKRNNEKVNNREKKNKNKNKKQGGQQEAETTTQMSIPNIEQNEAEDGSTFEQTTTPSSSSSQSPTTPSPVSHCDVWHYTQGVCTNSNISEWQVVGSVRLRRVTYDSLDACCAAYLNKGLNGGRGCQSTNVCAVTTEAITDMEWITEEPTRSPTTPEPTPEPITPSPTAKPTKKPTAWRGKRLSEDSVLHYKVDEDAGTFSGKIIHDGEAWVGLAFSNDGRMVGSEAVIGTPSDGIVQKYVLGDSSKRGGPTPMSDDKQTLTRADCFINDDGQTIMKFTKPLVEDGEIEIYAGESGEDNIMLHASGWSGDSLGYHKSRMVFTLRL